MTVIERVRKITANVLQLEEEKVTEGASFVDDLGADSLDAVELVMEFEQEFDVEIADEDAEEIVVFGKISDVVSYFESRTALSEERAGE